MEEFLEKFFTRFKCVDILECYQCIIIRINDLIYNEKKHAFLFINALCVSLFVNLMSSKTTFISSI